MRFAEAPRVALCSGRPGLMHPGLPELFRRCVRRRRMVDFGGVRDDRITPKSALRPGTQVRSREASSHGCRG